MEEVENKVKQELPETAPKAVPGKLFFL